MQSVVNAASAASNAALNAANSVLSATGLGSTTTPNPGTDATGSAHTGSQAAADGAHARAAHAHGHGAGSAQPPADATVGQAQTMDSEGLAVFEDEAVRHAVLVKINQLAIDDKRHGLKELASLDLVTEHGNRGVDYYHPKRYLTVTRPSGVDFIGEIEIEDGKSIHVRCHTPHGGGKATFHSLDTRPGQEGGAVFKTGDELVWFEY